MYTLMEVITEMSEEYQGIVFESIAAGAQVTEAVRWAMEKMHQADPNQYMLIRAMFPESEIRAI